MNWSSLLELEELESAVPVAVDTVCDRFETAWKAVGAGGLRPRIEEYVNGTAEPERSLLLRELIALEVAYRYRHGEIPMPDDYGPLGSVLDAASLAAEFPTQDVAMPPRLGRYRLTGVLGGGGFGMVYKAFDEELCREVAVKVPRPGRLASPEQARAYLDEGRVLASLDHPGIVPVYDTGRTEDGTCYLVSKLIPGQDLGKYIRQARIGHGAAAAIVARVAEALDHAHRRGLVHRDIKPANILLDAEGNPFVADFGLALRTDDAGQGPAFAGTMAYMSPEQARGAGHAIDPRTDVYSLGVVFYELLTGHRPFRAERMADLLDQIQTAEPRQPSACDDTVPAELERICLKALRKRPAVRYQTTAELAGELRAWLRANPDLAAEARARPLADGSCDTLRPAQTQSEFAAHEQPSTRALPVEVATSPAPRRRKGVLTSCLAAAAVLLAVVAWKVKEYPRPQEAPADGRPARVWGKPVSLLENNLKPAWCKLLYGDGAYDLASGYFSLHTNTPDEPTYLALDDGAGLGSFELRAEVALDRLLLRQDPRYQVGIFFGWRDYPADQTSRLFTLSLSAKPVRDRARTLRAFGASLVGLAAAPHGLGSLSATCTFLSAVTRQRGLLDDSGDLAIGAPRIAQPRLGRGGDKDFWGNFLGPRNRIRLADVGGWHRVVVRVEGTRVWFGVDGQRNELDLARVRQDQWKLFLPPEPDPHGMMGVWVWNGYATFKNIILTPIARAVPEKPPPE